MPQLLLASLRSSLSSALVILKYIVPFYILADILLYFDLIKSISFLFTPITSILHLPAETAVVLASGILINLYAAIALAVPMGLSPFEWTILAVFLGVCHSLVVESAIMSKLGISSVYSVLLRIICAFIAVVPLFFLSDSLFQASQTLQQQSLPVYGSMGQMLLSSLTGALILSVKVILLISGIIVVMDIIKALPLVKEYTEKVNTSFSILVGQLLGITYGAGILIGEANKGNLSREDIFYIATFLMICHSLIEDVLLFTLFGANFWVIVVLRLTIAIVLSPLMVRFVFRPVTARGESL